MNYVLENPDCLLNPYQLNSSFKLKNRIVMAPMTRRFADHAFCPTSLMADYYTRRAGAGLIITEGTIISEDALGYGNVPGIYTAKQINAWRKITDAVHDKNGVIFLQLWHCGRVSHPNFHKGQLPISASAITMSSPLGNSGFFCGESRAASISEIKNLIVDYAQATENALVAGFDGIEIHAANGYLIDQFLHHCSNQRTDEYGASPENMARFCLEIVTACAKVIGEQRVGLRLSPGGHMAEIITDPRDQLIFSYLLSQLNKIDMAYIHLGNFDHAIRYEALSNNTPIDFSRTKFNGTLISAGSYTNEIAYQEIKNNKFDLVAFGRPFIANFDLISKISEGLAWKPYQPSLLANLY